MVLSVGFLVYMTVVIQVVVDLYNEPDGSQDRSSLCDKCMMVKDYWCRAKVMMKLLQLFSQVNPILTAVVNRFSGMNQLLINYFFVILQCNNLFTSHRTHLTKLMWK